MTRPTRTILALAAAAVLAITGTGCSTTKTGQAQPAGDQTGTPGTGSASRTPTTSRDNNAAALDALDPCTLLTPAELSQFGADAGKRDDTTGARACQWLMRGQGVFSVAIRGQSGLKDIVTDLGTPVDNRVGSHDGKMLKDDHGPNSGSCLIAIGITASSRVDVNSSTRIDTAKACDVSTRVAGLVEPRLPKGE